MTLRRGIVSLRKDSFPPEGLCQGYAPIEHTGEYIMSAWELTGTTQPLRLRCRSCTHARAFSTSAQ